MPIPGEPGPLPPGAIFASDGMPTDGGSTSLLDELAAMAVKAKAMVYGGTVGDGRRAPSGPSERCG